MKKCIQKNKMKVLVVGASGQLGKDVTNELKKRNHKCISSDIMGEVDFVMDATNLDECKAKINKIKPEAIINCAAWTAVDKAEDEENKDKVYALNVNIPHNLKVICKDLDII